MNVELITMDRKEAQRRLAPYRKALHRRADAEYQAVVDAYEAIEEGLPVLSLAAAFGGTPRDDKGRPRIAIARADRRQVYYTRSSHTHADMFSSEMVRSVRDGRFTIPLDDRVPLVSYASGYATVPMVPPDVRTNRDLAHHFTLWEVEVWADRRINARGDRDPYLLRRLSVDLYAVVGEWELSEIERAIMTAARMDR